MGRLLPGPDTLNITLLYIECQEGEYYNFIIIKSKAVTCEFLQVFTTANIGPYPGP